MRPPRAYRSAFTLVELLTVAGIIALLIGILVPSLQSARAQARRTSSMSTIRSLESGLEAFHNDFREYPDSSSGTPANQRLDPVKDLPNTPTWPTNARLYGAHWLARALAGHDLSGVDSGQLVLQDGSILANQILMANDRLKGNRKGPYLEKVDLCVRDMDNRFLRMTGPETGRPVVVDAFNFPIIYYKAHPKAQKPFSDLGDSADDTGPVAGLGVYNHDDNAGITGCEYPGRPAGWQLVSGGAEHPLKRFVTDKAYHQPTANITDGGFVDQLDDDAIRAATATTTNPNGTIKPVKPESYILITPGKDGLYGTDDDVNNFKGK